MPIDKNAGGGGGNFINSPGEYRVKVHETKVGLSKKGKPMLTVTFETADEQSIRGYFVKDLAFHMKSLEALKIGCGIKTTEAHDNLVGKECGILVEAQEPDSNGRTFMQIVGYGKVSDLTNPNGNGGNKGGGDFAKSDDNEVPF